MSLSEAIAFNSHGVNLLTVYLGLTLIRHDDFITSLSHSILTVYYTGSTLSTVNISYIHLIS